LALPERVWLNCTNDATRGQPSGGDAMSQRPDAEPPDLNRIAAERDRGREVRRRASSGLATLFVIAGSALNLLAIILLITNIATLSRLWLGGQPVPLGAEQLAPFGAFLAGLLCFGIAWNLD
jgi:hypothetical protein